MWKFGCGVTLLGLALSLASCGLFGTAFQRAQGERSIAVFEAADDTTGSAGSVDVEPGARLRIGIEAAVEPRPADLARADSTAAVLTASLPVEFRVETVQGTLLARGAQTLTGHTAIPAADHPARRDSDPRIELRWRSEAFEAPDGGTLVVRVDVPDVDTEGRRHLGVRTTVYDRAATGVGRLTAGGALGFLLGPLVAFAGFVIFALGLLLRQRSRSTPKETSS